ncbi:Oxysterol-binding protein 3 [Blastocladiella emersonii ATCC 22665]|nr:Oxysterol-binding protein 3 [Blastocladiella emersonii ATCC 22665]
MQEIEIPPRDCFKYYVQVSGTPKTIMWNFSTKRKNIGFGLFYQIDEHAAHNGHHGRTASDAAASVTSPATKRRNLLPSFSSSSNNNGASSSSSAAAGAGNGDLSEATTIGGTESDAPCSDSGAGATSAAAGGKRNRTKSSASTTAVREPLLEPVVPISRFESSKTTIKGQKSVTRDGTYVLYFDNTFSRNTSKKMTFFVAMRDGEAKEEERQAELTGWLLKKKRKRMQGWAKRYFQCDRGQLAYYKFPGGFCRGSVPIALSTISVDVEHRIINIDSGTSLWHLRALTRADYDMWVDVIKRYKAVQAEVFRAASLSRNISMDNTGGAVGPASAMDTSMGSSSSAAVTSIAAAPSTVLAPGTLPHHHQQHLTASPPSASTVTLPSVAATSSSAAAAAAVIAATGAGAPASTATSVHDLMRQFVTSVDAHVSRLHLAVGSAAGPIDDAVLDAVRALAHTLAAEKEELLDQVAADAARARTLGSAATDLARENAELRARFGADAMPSASVASLAASALAASPALGNTGQRNTGSFHRHSMTLPLATSSNVGGASSPQFAAVHARAGSIASTVSDQWFDAEDVVLSAGGGHDSDDELAGSSTAAAVAAMAAASAAVAAGGGAQAPEMVIYEKRAGNNGVSMGEFEAGDEEDDDDDDDDDSGDDDDDDESGYSVFMGKNGANGNNGNGAGTAQRPRRGTASSAGSTSAGYSTALAVVERRRFLPSPVVGDDVSLLGLLRKNVGKDLSTVSMPISLNEPINLLQKLAEDLEYSELLDRAAVSTDSMQRLYLVAAFAVSSYASSANRSSRKPFNPLHGETYECVRPDKGFRFVAEKVSHYPPIMACHAEATSGAWVFHQDSRLKSKFWGKSMELIPSGTLHVRLPGTGDHFSWAKVTTCMRNLIGGPKSLDHYGKMVVKNHATGERAEITFKENGGGGWLGGGPSTANEVVGVAYTARGSKAGVFRGRWSELCMVTPADDPAATQVLWRANDPLPNCQEMYGFTQFTIELNEITPDIADYLPPTDTRFRPDQVLFERGLLPEAEAEKVRLEEKQRAFRRALDADGKTWTPQWFEPATANSGDDEWVYKGGYWETREAKAWPDVIDLYSNNDEEQQ